MRMGMLLQQINILPDAQAAPETAPETAPGAVGSDAATPVDTPAP
jgi:hypothetical protein